MWVYGSFIVFTIIGFGTMTLLRNSFLRGDTAAVALAGFIALFWVLRVLTDFFYFDKSDWPKEILRRRSRDVEFAIFLPHP